jgi:hypothetical protein
VPQLASTHLCYVLAANQAVPAARSACGTQLGREPLDGTANVLPECGGTR